VAKPLPPAWVLWQRELREAGLDPTAKLVGWCLSTYMDGAGRAQVGRTTLARSCGVSMSTVRRALGRLERSGLVAVDHGGGADVNRYQVRSTGGWPAPPPGSPMTPLPGSPVSLGGVTHDPQPGSPMTPERKGLKTKARAGAHAGAPEGWVPEDDPAIAAEFAARERLRVNGQERGDGYGDPTAAQLARDAAADARRTILGGES